MAAMPTSHTTLSLAPSKTIPVYPSDAFRVSYGANEGDGLSFAEDLMLDDVYILDALAQTISLSLARQGRVNIIADTSEAGISGSHIHLDCTVTLMDYGTKVTEVLVLVEVDAAGHANQVYLMPLAPLEPKVEYRLVGIDTQSADRKLAQVACVSFTRGTQIALATGRQRKVEDLRAGDAVLTRDCGAQKIRWIGQNTQRAVGAFAPIKIAAGELNNINDLVVSPDHRLFIYQRTDHLQLGRAELLIKARYLVNGTSVTIQEGGFVDYFQLLFDSHQIIYAEGIAAESMLVDDTTAPLLDKAVLKDLELNPKIHRELDERDVQKALLNRSDAIDLLRKASKG